MLKIGPDRDAVVSFHSGSVMDWAPQEALAVKDLAGNAGDVKRCGLDPWVGKIPCRRKWQPTAVFLPTESPRTEEPSRLQSTGSEGVGHN